MTEEHKIWYTAAKYGFLLLPLEVMAAITVLFSFIGANYCPQLYCKITHRKSLDLDLRFISNFAEPP